MVDRGIEYIPPVPSWMLKNDVHEFAETTASLLGFAIADPVGPLVARLDGDIVYRDFFEDIRQESIEVDPDETFVIYLPSLTSLKRDRFTVAHELGHFFLHFPIIRDTRPGLGMRATRWVDEENEDLKRTEWEANWFAGAFLMPEEEFRVAHRADSSSASLATKFAVSEKAVKVRAKVLSLEVN